MYLESDANSSYGKIVFDIYIMMVQFDRIDRLLKLKFTLCHMINCCSKI